MSYSSDEIKWDHLIHRFIYPPDTIESLFEISYPANSRNVKVTDWIVRSEPEQVVYTSGHFYRPEILIPICSLIPTNHVIGYYERGYLDGIFEYSKNLPYMDLSKKDFDHIKISQRKREGHKYLLGFNDGRGDISLLNLTNMTDKINHLKRV